MHWYNFTGVRAESSLLKARLDAQTKEINQQKLQIKDLEEKERIANESVIFFHYISPFYLAVIGDL